MDFTQYQQSLIKCQYMSTVCNQLLNQLETKALIKILQKNKLISQEDGQKVLTKYDRIEFEYKQKSYKAHKEYQARAKRLDLQIKQHEQHINKIKNQISFLRESRFERAASTRLNIKKIKQTSELQLQSVQLRKLLNFQLQNLNSLEISNIELNEAIEKYEKKQIELKAKIKKVVQKENDYVIWKDMEEKYDALLLAKRKLVQQNAMFDSQKHTEVFNKISSIAQANENMVEMVLYEKELGVMIKQKQFIIEEIEHRESVNIKKKAKGEISSDDDTQIFQEEVNNLRKTIVNRKFQQRARQNHAINKLEAFLNDSTPKNSINSARNEEAQKKPKEKHESIFKIEIAPVSQLKGSTNQKTKNYQRQNRNSMPNQISNQPLRKSPPKHSQLPKYSLSENKIPEFNTIQIATLEQIIKNKQSRIQQTLERGSVPSRFSRSPIYEIKSQNASPMVRNTQHNKKIMITQPFEQKNTSETSISKKINNSSVMPNSRFIEQIIESTNSDQLERLKDNVRIRTKKSQSQKYRHLEEFQNRKKSQHKKISSELRQSKFSSIQTIKASVQLPKQIAAKKGPSHEKKTKEMALSFDSTYDNEFIGLDIRQNCSEQKTYKPKYKDRIQNFSEQRSSLQDLLGRIDLLKRVKQDANRPQQENLIHESGEKKEMKEKVKVIKLSSRRKYGNGISFSRKGKAEGMENFDSDQQLILPKIQEEEESIRNTLQSIPQAQQRKV